jgi:hypothetical protein
VLFTACDSGNKTPDESELVNSGNSLKEALPAFKALSDNYMYKETIKQTNGEDWFNFTLVKLDNGNIYNRSQRLNNNAGWQYADTIFTDYEDLTDKDYTLYLKQQDNNYIEYRKYEDSSSETNFTKYYYINNADNDVNERADYFFYHYDFFETDDFEYFETTDDNGGTVPYWRVKQDLLSDTDFKSSFSDGIKQFGKDGRLDYVYLYVTENKVTSLQYGYYSHVTSNVDMIFHNTIDFFYDNYQFDGSSLSGGFTLYENV